MIKFPLVKGRLRYGKTVRNALGIVAFLARDWPTRTVRTAKAVSEGTELPLPWVARLLRHLAESGAVQSVRGPGGGFRLKNDPASMCLWDVAAFFQGIETESCPSGYAAELSRSCFTDCDRLLSDWLRRHTFAAFAAPSDGATQDGSFPDPVSIDPV